MSKLIQHKAENSHVLLDVSIGDVVKFDGCQMRRDIGYRAIGRK